MGIPTIIHFLFPIILTGSLVDIPAHLVKNNYFHKRGIVSLHLKEVTYYSGSSKEYIQCKVYVGNKCFDKYIAISTLSMWSITLNTAHSRKYSNTYLSFPVLLFFVSNKYNRNHLVVVLCLDVRRK